MHSTISITISISLLTAIGILSIAMWKNIKDSGMQVTSMAYNTKNEDIDKIEHSKKKRSLYIGIRLFFFRVTQIYQICHIPLCIP